MSDWTVAELVERSVALVAADPERATESLGRFLRAKERVCIPPQPSDDDLVLMATVELAERWFAFAAVTEWMRQWERERAATIARGFCRCGPEYADRGLVAPDCDSHDIADAIEEEA